MKNIPEISIKDYSYTLPQERIALHPLPERDESKLLMYKDGRIEETVFKNLPEYLPKSSSLILNNTRVIEARILFQKPTGGVIEIFCLEPYHTLNISTALKQHNKVLWQCLVGGASKWKPGTILKKVVTVNGKQLSFEAKYVSKNVDAFVIEFIWGPAEFSFDEVLHSVGKVPLPPYIKRNVEEEDHERYQTIFARNEGSVAAPTAALHFTSKIFSDLEAKGINYNYVTLHVGAGTFKPVKTETIAEHTMHAEEFEVTLDTLKSLQGDMELVAVGTTSLRTLESLYWIGIKILNGLAKEKQDLNLGQWEAYELNSENISNRESIRAIIDFLDNIHETSLICHTSLLIIPGYKFRSAKGLVTNFHQPQSTLLLLIAAFIGEDWKKVYNYALENDFRFLSYGDSNLLWRKD